MGLATAIVHRALDGCVAHVRLESDEALQPKEVEEQVIAMLRSPEPGQMILWNQPGEPMEFAESEDYFVEQVIIDQAQQDEIVVPLEGNEVLSAAGQQALADGQGEGAPGDIDVEGLKTKLLASANEAASFVAPDGTSIARSNVNLIALGELGFDLLLVDGTEVKDTMPEKPQEPETTPTETGRVEGPDGAQEGR